MNSYSYIRLTVILILLFIIYHLFIWFFFTSKIFNLNDDYHVGDLGRTSYQLDMLHPRQLNFTLEKKHFHRDNWNGEKIDIITIGDSFSHAGAGGLNPSYQDYLSTHLKLNILNIDGNPFETIISLLNNGTLETLKPKAIVVQYVGRYLTQVFAKDFDFSKTYTNNSLSEIISKKPTNPYIPKLALINSANYKVPYYKLMYKVAKQPQKALIKLNLSKQLFSVGDNTMLVDSEDIRNIALINENSVKKINDNFNTLASLLKSLDIKLFFMPAPDKYDLYFDYILNNPYPKNNFFSLIEPLNKKYFFVNSKNILLKQIAQNEKDIYFVDDTHWSHKASEAISKDNIFQVLLKSN